MKKTPLTFLCWILLFSIIFISTGCAPTLTLSQSVLQPTARPALLTPSLVAFTPVPQTPDPSPKKQTRPTLTQTHPAASTATTTPTLPPPRIPTLKDVLVTPGKVTVPILLYHHVKDVPEPGSRYVVSPANFAAQMQALSDWGYQPVTVTQVSDWLQNGGHMPARPVAITFDDSNRDIYENAFPILKQHHFIATMYVIGNTLGADGYFTVDMLKEISAAGWEIGSHSMTHVDLTKSGNLNYELCGSRDLLTKTLGVTVWSVAYPYGIANQHVFEITKDCGYSSGAGLGILNDHPRHSLLYLSRREVLGGASLDAFTRLLP